LTVVENLEMGAYLRTDSIEVKRDMDRMFELFPRLRERRHQLGITLSGGEQQMLAMARALLSNPKILLMDEPSMGLAPVLVDQQFELIQMVHQKGTTVFVVEQNANMALSIANRGYVLQTGSIVLSDTAKNLLHNEMMQKAYLGGST
jgi:branched-chain amino acid transport system ATP-binding protein